MAKAGKDVTKARALMMSDLNAAPVKSAKPSRRVVSRLKKVRSARGASEALESSAERSEKVAAAVAAVSEASPSLRAEHPVKPAGKKAAPPRGGMLSAVCFWAGTVISDSNVFLRLKKAK